MSDDLVTRLRQAKLADQEKEQEKKLEREKRARKKAEKERDELQERLATLEEALKEAMEAGSENQGLPVDLAAKAHVDEESVPIDALRGIFYFIVGQAEKRMPKHQLKATLQHLLSSKEKVAEMLQNIIDTVFS